jgi:hypothetical protein
MKNQWTVMKLTDIARFANVRLPGGRRTSLGGN